LKNSPSKAVLCAALLTLAIFAGVGVRPAEAAHKPACWQVLLNDWYDGRIDGTYPIHCYQDALKHLPADVDTYSSARDDIQRALQSARAAARKEGRSLTPGTLIHPATGKGVKPHKGGNTISVVEPGRKQGKGLAGVAGKIDSGGASSLPVPLLVLGGLALLLVALGGAGLLVKHLQGRKPAS
jgi:hypothetical protein